MVNSGSINGVPATSSAMLLSDILRDEFGCANCVALTDWQDILKLWQYHDTAPTYADAIVAAFTGGIDMSMVPYDASPAVPFFPGKLRFLYIVQGLCILCMHMP